MITMYDEIVYLLKEKIAKDDIGQVIKTYDEIMVFAKNKPIQQQEFFSARQSGIKATLCLEIGLLEYDGELILKYNNKKYSVYRTYPKSNTIELYCEIRSGVD